MTEKSDLEAFWKEKLDEFMRINTDILAVEAYIDTLPYASRKYRKLFQTKVTEEMSPGDSLSDPKERSKDGD